MSSEEISPARVPAQTSHRCQSEPHAEWLAKSWAENATRIQSVLQRYEEKASLPAADGTCPAPLVLVVDDEPAIAITLSRILDRHGFSSIWLTDPRTAAGLLGQLSLRLLITDIDMPAIDGISLAAIAQRSMADCPVLLFSSQGSESQTSERMSALGVSAHIELKPVALHHLLEVVRALVSGSH